MYAGRLVALVALGWFGWGWWVGAEEGRPCQESPSVLEEPSPPHEHPILPPSEGEREKGLQGGDRCEHRGKKGMRGCEPGKHPHRRGREGLFSLLKELNLTEEQKAKIQSLMKEHRQAMAPIRESLQKSRAQLRELARAQVVDESAIRATSQQIGTSLGDLTIQQARLRQAIRAILTPEQNKRLDEMKAKREQERKERQEQFRKRRMEQGPKRGEGPPPEGGIK